MDFHSNFKINQKTEKKEILLEDNEFALILALKELTYAIQKLARKS